MYIYRKNPLDPYSLFSLFAQYFTHICTHIQGMPQSIHSISKQSRNDVRILTHGILNLKDLAVFEDGLCMHLFHIFHSPLCHRKTKSSHSHNNPCLSVHYCLFVQARIMRLSVVHSIRNSFPLLISSFLHNFDWIIHTTKIK